MSKRLKGISPTCQKTKRRITAPPAKKSFIHRIDPERRKDKTDYDPRRLSDKKLVKNLTETIERLTGQRIVFDQIIRRWGKLEQYKKLQVSMVKLKVDYLELTKEILRRMKKRKEEKR